MDNMNTSCFPLALAALKSAKIANERIDSLPMFKSFTYTGNGLDINAITFPTKPQIIISIDGPFDADNVAQIQTFPYGVNKGLSWVIPKLISGGGASNRNINITYFHLF